MIVSRKPRLAFPIILIVLINLIISSQCSVDECYTCYFIEADNVAESDLPSIPHYTPDKSCRSSKKPDKDLISSCSHIKQEGVRFTCTKVYYHGKVIGGHVVKATARTCMPWPEDNMPDNVCSAKTLGEVINSTSSLEVRQVLGLFKEYVDESSSGLFCSCNSDSCNSATLGKNWNNNNFLQYIAVVLVPLLFHFQ